MSKKRIHQKPFKKMFGRANSSMCAGGLIKSVYHQRSVILIGQKLKALSDFPDFSNPRTLVVNK